MTPRGRGSPAFFHIHGDDSGQIAAGALSAENQTVWVAAKVSGMAAQETHHVPAFLQSVRIGVFRGQLVVYVKDKAVSPLLPGCGRR